MLKDYQKGQRLTFLNSNSTWSSEINNFDYNDLLTCAKYEFENATEHLYAQKGYKYIMDRFPAVSDDKIPTEVYNALKHKQTFACASQDGVFFSTEILINNLLDFYNNDKVKDRLKNDKVFIFDNLYKNVKYNLYGVIMDVLKHEYGHIINGHVFLNLPKDKTKTQAMIYTNEIEANRTIPFDSRSAYLRLTAVSDDNEPFTCCKECVTRDGIYKAILSMLVDRDEKQDNKGKSKNTNTKNEMPNNITGSQDNNGNKSKQKNTKYELPEIDSDIYHGRDTIQADDKKQAMDALCREIGVRPSNDIVDSEDPSAVLDGIQNASRNKEIQKTIEKLKGCVKGELCKDKVETYSRQTRKHTEDGMLRKGVKTGRNKRPNIVVALDASGSMDRVAIKTASSAIKTVIETIGRNSADISICTFSTSILRKGTLNDWEQIVSSYNPGGGTSFGTVMSWAIQHNADAVLCVGDGEDNISSANYFMEQFGVNELPKWIDILITPNVSDIEHIKKCYSPDELKGLVQRETLWIGDEVQDIEKALGTI